MLAGTTLMNYETVESPRGFMEEKGTQIRSTSTLGMLTVPKNTVIKNNYKFQVDLTAEVKVEDGKFLVVDYQIDEYGIGDSLEEAQKDLFNSLVDYLTSLQRRENRLGAREHHNLQILRRILTR